MEHRRILSKSPNIWECECGFSSNMQVAFEIHLELTVNKETVDGIDDSAAAILKLISKQTVASDIKMNIDEATRKACKEPTLLDALTFICIWECERAIKQARFNYGSGANGAGWDTFFKICLKNVMEKYNKPLENNNA